MTRRRIFLPPQRLAGGVARLTPEARHYLRRVLRLVPGTEIEVFDGTGGSYRASYADAEVLALSERCTVAAPAATIWLAFGLSKGEKPDLVIQKATELGAARILPWQAQRSVVRLEGERAESRLHRWRRIATEAARQCGRAEVPEVSGPAALAAVLETVPPAFARVAFDAGGESLGSYHSPGVLAVVGPEGGLAPEELDACTSAGCRLVSLGPRVLRAETAAIAVTALLQFLGGDLGRTRAFP
jgi:16S rRNA (uracil1498-N3)-methyltransferase